MSSKSIFYHRHIIILVILLAIVIVNSYSLNTTDHELNLTSTTQASFSYGAKEQPVSRSSDGGSGIGIYIGGGVGGAVGLSFLFLLFAAAVVDKQTDHG